MGWQDDPIAKRDWRKDPTVKTGGITAEPVGLEEQAGYEKQEWLQEQIKLGRIQPVKPTFGQKFKQDIPQMVGGTVGGITGAKLGAPLGPWGIFGGAVIGAGIGGMGGKGYQQLYQMTRPGAKAQTFGEIYTDQTIAGIEEAAAEFIGRGVARVGGKLLAPVKKRIIKGIGAGKLSRELLKRGAHITPAQLTESRIIDTLEGMAEKSFLGGGKLQRLKTILQPEAFSRYIDDVVKQIGKGIRRQLSPEDIGELLLDTISGKRAAFKATAKAAYSKVDQLAGRAQVSLVSLKNFAKQAIKTARTRKGIGSTQAGDTLLKRVLQLDDVITFKQAQALRSALIDEKGAMAITRDKAIGLAKQFIKITDNAMEQGTKGLSPEAYKAWRIANKFYRTGSQIFDKKLVRTLVKNLAENPEIAVKKIFRPGATEQIKVIKNLVDKKTWTILKESYLEQLLTEAGDVDKVVLGKSFLQKLNKIGEPALREIYSGEELRAIRSIGQMGQLLQRPTGGSGGMLIQLMQAGAVMNLGRMVLGGAPALAGESAVIVIGPPILSRMLANPTWAKWLSTGIKMPWWSPAAGALTTRLTRITQTIRNQISKEELERTQKRQLESGPTLKELRGFGGRGF